MKYLKTFETQQLFKDKIRKLVPEIYAILEYKSFNFNTLKTANYLFLTKIKSVPYKEEQNHFVDVQIIENENDQNSEYVVPISNGDALNLIPLNIDLMTILFITTSLEKAKLNYNKLKEEFIMKKNATKFNI